MYGLIVRLMLHPGKRDEMIEILQASAAGMPGCLSYVLAKDKSDQDVLWVTEVWDQEESHHASLALPTVKAAVPRAKPLVANFERIAVTEPIWGDRLKDSDEKSAF